MVRLAIPALFVLIWSTGFIAAKFAAPHSDLQLFLLIRLSMTTVIMAAFAYFAGVRAWPRGRQLGYQLLAGMLLQGVYLCFSYFAIEHGMPAGIMSLLGSLQPLFTALFVVAIGTRLPARVWIGLLIGFSGVACVLLPKIAHGGGADSIPLLAAATAVFSVLGVTAGALLQKWLVPLDLRAAASIQNLGGVFVAMAMTLVFGTGEWDGALELWAALAWSVIVASVVGTTLLVWMLRHGEATRVTALLLLVPPLASLQAFFFFGERLTLMQFVGLALALGGVLLARSAPAMRRG
jgi:drug/metabolite transporter (DMT)-like permease